MIKFIEMIVDTFFVSPQIITSQLGFILSLPPMYKIQLDPNSAILSHINDMIHPLTRWQQLNPLGEKISSTLTFGSSTWPLPLIFLLLSAPTIPVILSLLNCFFSRSDSFPMSLNHILTLDSKGILVLNDDDEPMVKEQKTIPINNNHHHNETKSDDEKSPSQPVPPHTSNRYHRSKSATLFASFLSTLDANRPKSDDDFYDTRPLDILPPLSLTPLHYIIWNSKFHFPPSLTRLSRRPGAEEVVRLMIEYYLESLIDNTTDQIHKPYRTLFQQLK